jgi:hypothetical protein
MEWLPSYKREWVGRVVVAEEPEAGLLGEPTWAGAINRDPGNRLGVNQGAVMVAIHRLRRRFREVIKNKIGQTVSGLVDAELHYLLEALL